MLTQHPQLVHAAILQGPLLDLNRGDLLGSQFPVGFKFPAEYGPAELQQQISPFQHLRRGEDLPVPLISAATNDDRVRPGQPRRFAAKMEALHLPFFYVETDEGGHGDGWTAESRARADALRYTYLIRQLADEAVADRP